jgi:hypothetical protein
MPDAEGNAAAALEDAECLTEECVRVREMGHAEVADDGIEAAVREGERTGVAFAELDGRVLPPGEGELRRGEVDPNRHGVMLGRRSRGVARAGGNVHHPRAAPHPGGIQECPDRLRCNAGEAIVVSGGNAFR